MAETEDVKPKEEILYFDLEGNEVKDKSQAVRIWIRYLHPETGELLAEHWGLNPENIPFPEPEE